MKILVVCLGNICRSPMAEGVLRHKFEEAGVDVDIDSAGTGDFHIGEGPDKRAVANMDKNGHDISKLRARQFTVSDFDTYDEIYVMDESNYENVIALARNDSDKKKVDLFMNLSHPGENIDVPDPYFGGESGFQKVYEMLSQSADVLISKLNGR
ncbi:low molecular weight phosphotyrosine protein phosphatase [Cryomorpha ignava]|uniref:protein-tyrosine-phosphatase n=1 Tax=Cryomorpha ignava TaxID=101383 RepID=A0A7K3WLR2_9FLAO|nr:low molecular weight protein-tyrosine-phosphatase [Cryomorpha ignava]NEN22590.1 low molecular weight phosphotyrosine protein phosphatase [Cryomorpha ignava]